MPPLVLRYHIDQVHPHPDDDPTGDVDALVETLRVSGQYRAILVNRRDMTILSGVRTWEAARQLGWEQIAVTFVNVDEDEARRIMVEARPLEGYDEGSLGEMLQTLQGDWTPPTV